MPSAIGVSQSGEKNRASKAAALALSIAFVTPPSGAHQVQDASEVVCVILGRSRLLDTKRAKVQC
jgi:hypothetical protein